MVRVESSNDGAIVSAVELDGKGGYDKGKVTQRLQRGLNDTERRRLATALDTLRFFELPTEEHNLGLDGANWILEGRMASKYHVVDRWTPLNGSFREFCLSLLKLVDWLPQERRNIY